LRVYQLKDSLSKVLLIKTFDHGVSVMEFITTTSGKPRCTFLFHVFNLRQAPVVPVSTYVQLGMVFKPSHFVLGVKRVPLAMARHVVSRVYAALPSIWKPKVDSGFPIFTNGVTTSYPFQRVASTRPHVMVAANENKRIHLAYQPLN
jgi:hypothetical protein